jgi:hypothetical protein
MACAAPLAGDGIASGERSGAMKLGGAKIGILGNPCRREVEIIRNFAPTIPWSAAGEQVRIHRRL